MLVITPPKIALFQAAVEEGFQRELAAYFRERHGSTIVRLPAGAATVSSIPDRILAKMVKTGVANAKSYGLTGQAAVAGFFEVDV
jgi:hypothetical protein